MNNPATVEVEDLSQSIAEPHAQKERHYARVAAARGIDVLMLTPACWMVCAECNLPAIAHGGTSICCYSPVRVQGWAL